MDGSARSATPHTQIGVLARSVADVALLLDPIAARTVITEGPVRQVDPANP